MKSRTHKTYREKDFDDDDYDDFKWCLSSMINHLFVSYSLFSLMHIPISGL